MGADTLVTALVNNGILVSGVGFGTILGADVVGGDALGSQSDCIS